MINRFANPARFMRLSAAALPWCGGSTVVVLAVGLYLALGRGAARLPAGRSRAHHVCPCAGGVDGDAASICSSRSPAPSPSSGGIRWPRSRRARRRRSAPAFTFVCLVTGSLWGRPMWGTWWVWDARLTSVLVLFFLYLGYIALVNALRRSDARRPGRRGAGAGRRGQPADHQILGRLVEHPAPAGERAAARRPTIAFSMLLPLLVMAAGVCAAVPAAC